MKDFPLPPLLSGSYLLFVLLILALGGCGQDDSSQQQAFNQPPPPVTVATPLVKDITDWDEFTGRIYAVESVEVHPRVSGYLQSVHFTEGSIVKQGDLLYVIDPRPYQAVLDQVRAAVTRAKASVDLAENDLERAERLFKSRAISEEEVDTRRNQKREALASLQEAQAAVKEAELDVEFTHIRAPITGRISRTRITAGNLVTGGDFESTLLTNIVSMDPVYVYFNADEQAVLHYTRMDLAGIRESSRTRQNPVLLKLADEEDYLHQGMVDFVDNQIDLSTGTMRARAVVSNPDLLLVPGMFADVRLQGEGPYPALLIPDSAIGTDQTIRYVYVVDENNTVSRRQIKTGHLQGGLRVVRSGLEASDRIIINGIQRARDGMVVAPEDGVIDDPAANAQG